MKIDLYEDQLYSCRREFAFACVAFGFASLMGPRAFAYKHKELGIPPYSGPLLDVMNKLTLDWDSGRITPEQYVQELGKRLQDIKPKVEFMPWMDARKPSRDELKLYPSDRKTRKPALSLVYTKPNWAHIPHGHHSLASVQMVVDGELYVREYDRVKVLDKDTLALRKVTDRILKPGEFFGMTDLKHNIHWFGSEGKPVIHLNSNINMLTGKTFYPRKSRRAARIYVEPTKDRTKEGLIIAKVHTKKADMESHWDRYRRTPLSKFRGV